MAYLLHDPSEDLNYSFNWATRLGAATISTSIWAISPTGPTIDTTSNTSTVTTAFVSGLTRGEVYRLINTVTTSTGTTERDSVTIRCEAR